MFNSPLLHLLNRTTKMTPFSDAVMQRLFLLTTLASASSPSSSLVAAAAAEPTGSEWRSDLNWTELESSLSPSASLIDTSYEKFRDECWSEFVELAYFNISVSPNPSNYALIDQPSGVCSPNFFLGWEIGWPRPSDDGHLNGTVDQYAQDMLDPFSLAEIVPDYVINDETNPSLNLPPKVLFPSIASDVIKSIKFAKENTVEISVKNSGHSYTSASSKKDTLNLNMNRYKQYAPDGITDCDAALLGTAVADDLSNQACLLALARGKPAVIRVGGGENFDKVYRAVIDANQALEEYKYHLVGGAAGTVSPMGWTWQGGNAGTTGGRLYGTGVDQVLQVEMVLPNGYHVKFGPTEWEDASAEGFAVPRTTAVSGVCRSNPDEEDEEKWIWEDCPEGFDIDFGDLWFAVRGGGGGSWGVVTSVHLQLHDILTYNHFVFRSTAEECSALAPAFLLFQAMYYMSPALLDVSKEKSIACSTADGGNTYLFCYGEEDVMGAWERFLELNNSTDPSASACVVKSPDFYQEFGFSYEPTSYKSYPDEMLLFSPTPGKIGDGGGPKLISNAFGHVLVPQSWIDESEENINILLKNLVLVASPYHAYGEATFSFSDQADSLSQAHREAATMISLYSYDATEEANFWSNLFPKMFDISDKTKFPPVFGSNHAGPLLSGPLKEDWTKMCPREWTFEERREKCISPQEAIYGTELLSRLEAIKMAVDPQFMFNCNNCVANNLDVAKAPEVPIDEPSGASIVSTFATAISATVLHLVLSIWY